MESSARDAVRRRPHPAPVTKQKILVIEDEKEIRELIRYHLERERYRVAVAGTGEEGVASARREIPDLILLDLMLPGMDGLEVCRALRTDPNTAKIPIVILTARTEETEVVAGLEVGADDYIGKPFQPRVLIARLRAVMRRHEADPAAPEEVLTYGELSIDEARYRVTLRGQSIRLTLTEFRILSTLMHHPGRVQSRSQLLAAVQDRDVVVLDRTIDVHMTALRKKLGPFGRRIETVRGLGYRLSDQ